MRIASIAFAALFALTAGGADAALLALAPANYTAVISANMPKLMGNRDVRALVASPWMTECLSGMERVGVRVADIRELAVFSWDTNWYGAMRIDAAKLRKALELRCADSASDIVAETVCGRRVYRLKMPPRPDGRHRKKELCLTLFGDDTALFAKFIELEKFLKARRIDAAGLAELAARDADVWLVCRMRDDPEDKKNNGGAFDIREGSLELRLTGGEATAISLAGTGTFPDPEKARSMSMTLPGIVAFFAGLIFAEDPEGGDLVVRALRTEVRGDTMRLSLELSEDLFRRFLRGLESFGDRQRDGGAAAGAAPRRSRDKH